jgi:primosomal protein N' (replication factor Y)
MPVLRLAIASPLRRLFDYLPPPELSAEQLALLRPGIRVQVPFGKRQLAAILVEVSEESAVDPEKLRPALELIDHSPIISDSLLQLCHWAASYYKHPLGEILAAALPTRLRHGQAHSPASTTLWQLTIDGKGLPEGALRRAPRQAELLALLQQRGSLPATELAELGISATITRQLREKGLAETVERDLSEEQAICHPGLALNEEQAVAVKAVSAEPGKFCCYLLEGVTGSGKTEVYLQLVQRTLDAGRQALVLIPEIGLTPQTLARFQHRFTAHIVVLHSGLTDVARLQAWEAARSGRAHIVLGTRSAIFTSLRNPGLIIVDEEHDASFKQQEGFRYSARDLAVKRAQLEDIPIVLGTATPSLESLGNALSGRYQHLRLQKRASTSSTLPEFDTLDVRRQVLEGGMSVELLEAVGRQLTNGNQVLLFLNRRGYAPTLQCHSCGFVAGCPHCDSRLTLHKRAAELRCHHCDWRTPLPRRCPQCQSGELAASGVGTEQAEAVLAQKFPDFPLYRVDRDSMQPKGAMESLVKAANSGRPALLLGAQMLTKGHHFPDVTLVGLLDTDAALFSADFRGAERMGQLLTQVAGRAGRASKPGRVMLQTHYPDHPLLLLLLARGYHEYARSLLLERQQTAMPPYGYLLLVRAEARDLSNAENFLHTLRQQAVSLPGLEAQFVGPIPAPLQRKRGFYRAQMLVSCPNRSAAQQAAEILVARAEALPEGKRLRWSLDVDPQDMM